MRETLCGGELGPEIPQRYGGAKKASAAAAYGGYGGGAAPRQEELDRVDYAAAFDIGGFEGVTVRTLRMAGSLEEPYVRLPPCAALSDCYEAGPEDAVLLYRQQHQGATYRSLAAVAYRAGMRKAQRVRWYRIADDVPFISAPLWPHNIAGKQRRLSLRERSERLVTTERCQEQTVSDDALEQELNALVERRGAMFRDDSSEAVMLEQWERSRQKYRERQRIERLEAWMVWRESQVRGFDWLPTEHQEKAALLAEQLMELGFGDSI